MSNINYRDRARNRWGQVLMNRFVSTRRLKYNALHLDGIYGRTSRKRARVCRYYLGLTSDIDHASSDLTDEFIRLLKDPRSVPHGWSAAKNRQRLKNAGNRQRERQAALTNRWGQILMNRYTSSRKLGYRNIREDGDWGNASRKRAKTCRYFMGLTGDIIHASGDLTESFINLLKKPTSIPPGWYGERNKRRITRAGLRQRARRKWLAQQQGSGDFSTALGYPHWGGSAHAVRRTQHIPPKAGAPLTSAKRARNHPLSLSNPGSDHNEANRSAYAHDYATFRGSGIATAIRRYWGNYAPASGTYAGYYVRVNGSIFRLQTLWAVSGHFNHVHHGARR